MVEIPAAGALEVGGEGCGVYSGLVPAGTGIGAACHADR